MTHDVRSSRSVSFLRTELRRLSTPSYRPIVIATATAAFFCLIYLLVPRMGGDLSAQMARADFARDHPLTPVDFRWYGGAIQFNYSLWSAFVMSVIGVRLAGAIAVVAATALLVRLLQRAHAPHPLLAGVAGAVTLMTNLVEGRVTFAQGVACGLGALLAIAEPTKRRRILALVLAFLSAGASPVAGLFVLLCAGVLLLDRHIVDALVLAAGSAAALFATSVIFGDAGRQTFGMNDAMRAIEVSLLVLIVVGNKRVRIGALLGVIMVLCSWLMTTPVGSNSIRLTMSFGLPLLLAWLPNLAVARSRLRVGLEIAVVVALVFLIQPSLWLGTLGGTGRPATYANYYEPLVNEIRARGPIVGRVEVPEITGHWESAYLARDVPLARGWLRQLDTKLNAKATYQKGINATPTLGVYREFLDRNAVQYVAVADSRATYYGFHEKQLIDARPVYLDQVWANEHWTLYEVRQPTPIVSSPNSLVSYEPDKIVVSVTAPGDALIRIRWLRFLTLSGPGGACLSGAGQEVVIRNAQPGQYTIGSSVLGSRHC